MQFWDREMVVLRNTSAARGGLEGVRKPRPALAAKLCMQAKFHDFTDLLHDVQNRHIHELLQD